MRRLRSPEQDDAAWRNSGSTGYSSSDGCSVLGGGAEVASQTHQFRQCTVCHTSQARDHERSQYTHPHITKCMQPYACTSLAIMPHT